jgi:nucleoside-diphosphate-sugar epimerase
MNILITGVAGLVGANFAEYILSKRQELGINKVLGVDDIRWVY